MTEFTSEFIEELKYDIVFHSEDEQIKQRIIEALDHIERQQQRIAELEQERRWIPVSEFETETGGMYVYQDSQGIAVGYFQPQDKKHFQLEHYEKYVFGVCIPKPQPLPQPPKEATMTDQRQWFADMTHSNLVELMLAKYAEVERLQAEVVRLHNTPQCSCTLQDAWSVEDGGLYWSVDTY